MAKLSIEFFDLVDIEKIHGQFGMDELYKTAEEVINEGGRVEIAMEYTNAPKDVLRTLKTIEEAKKFFKQNWLSAK